MSIGSGSSGRPIEPSEAARLFAAVYDELRGLARAKMAHERLAHTLDATALVHEAYLRIVKGTGSAGEPDAAAGSAAESSHSRFGEIDRKQFFAVAARAMEQILVDRARERRSQKRGGRFQRFELRESDKIVVHDPDVLLAISEAIERLAEEDLESAEIARLRLFAGFSIDEAASILGISRASAFREWSYARAWLVDALKGNGD